MPKKNSIDNIPQEKILREDEEPEEIPPPQATITKPKRQISDAQREHLNKIRAKALEKKAEMKEDTLKAKLAKTIEKKELAKKYDEYTQEKEKEQQEVKKEVKPAKKEKKIVYKLADSSSSSSDDEDEKVVYVKKIKDKNKKQIYHKKESVRYDPQSESYHPLREDSLDSTLYRSSQEILHKRAIEERVKANLIRWNNAMMPQEY
jgi:hypothetical protein